MFSGSLFRRSESFVGVDIGSTGVKVVELDLSTDKPALLNLGISPLSGDIFSNNVIVKVERAAEEIGNIFEANDIGDRRVITAVPGPSVFTKRIKIGKADLKTLRANIQLEAGNFIPHNIEAVRLDFHVIGEADGGQLDVLVVAAKNEIIDSLMECFAAASLSMAVVDVDYFAMQNIFELCYPELVDKTVALINVGARYSAINICRGGQSLFVGDIGIGGKFVSDALMEGLGVSADQAEELKKKESAKGKIDPQMGIAQDVLRGILGKSIDHIASEFNRQLSFFWNASGADEGIDRIMLLGGGSSLDGFVGVLSEKTGIECSLLEAFKGIRCGDAFDRAYLKELEPRAAIAVGLALRRPGDRITPEFE